MITETEPKSSPAVEIAHVLFMDIVAYSTLPMDQQQSCISALQEAVRSTSEFARALASDQLIRLPTGDGMALVFFGDPVAPVRCALELSKKLRKRGDIKLRMGIHSGPVYRVSDINANWNVAGGGINMAQRVMDCGDAGHILISKATADVLNNLSGWKNSLRDLGEATVKHGARIHVFNLCTEDAGNSEMPQKLRAGAQKTSVLKRRWPAVAGSVLGLAALAAIALFLSTPKVHALRNADTIVLADFTNKTGDPVFDDTLKTALGVGLQQSPFLNVLSDDKIQATLKLMAQPSDTALTPGIARELCQRVGSRAYIAGSIAALGSQYVVGLKAVDCRNGSILAQEQTTADAKEKVLDALGDSTGKLREQLGESLRTVQQFDVPLAQATTPSLEALQAYSLARKIAKQKGSSAALAYDQQAVQLDPNFALAYRAVASDYADLLQVGRAKEYYQKAFDLQDHESEREKLAFAADYYSAVTGELERAAQNYGQLTELYPRSVRALVNLSLVYAEEGRFDDAAALSRKALAIEPDNVAASDDLVMFLLALQHFDEARQTIRDAQSRGIDNYGLHSSQYALAFLASDSPAMKEQEQWFASKPVLEHFGLSLAASTDASAGRLNRARQLSKQAAEAAIRTDSAETGAIWEENAALREAAFGDPTAAKEDAAEGLKLAPASLGARVEAALTYALAGDTARAESLARQLDKDFPLDTQMQRLWLPTIQAQLALERKNPDSAIQSLQATDSMALGAIPFVNNNSCLYSTYIRGEAYLAAKNSSAAAAEFQKILDHSGIVWNCWTGSLARLGLARANALQSKAEKGADADLARGRALRAYSDFLASWKDADSDLPVFQQAKSEFAKMKQSQ